MKSPDTSRTPWIVAGACTYGTMWIYLTNITLPFAVGLFLKPESAEFGWDRATLSSGVLLSSIIGGLTAPFAGRAIDRWGARRIIMPGGVFFGLATAALSFANGSILQLYFLFALLGLCNSFSGTLAFGKLVSAWFKTRRGLALGLTAGIGTGIGGAISPWVIGYCINHFGWRGAYIALGLMIILFKVPSFYFLREPIDLSAKLGPEPVDTPQGSVPVIAVGKTVREAMRTRAFWALMAITVTAGIATGGSLVHLLPFLEERGETEQYAKFLLSTIAIVSTAGRVVTGLFLDRFETPKTAILVYLSLLVGLILVDYGPLGVVFTAVLIIGFGVGAEGGGIIGYFIARYFGLRSFAEITGYNFTAALIALGIGPVVVGRLYTMTGSYHIAFIVLDTALALTIACVFLLGPYVYDLKPPRRGDRRG